MHNLLPQLLILGGGSADPSDPAFQGPSFFTTLHALALTFRWSGHDCCPDCCARAAV